MTERQRAVAFYGTVAAYWFLAALAVVLGALGIIPVALL